MAALKDREAKNNEEKKLFSCLVDLLSYEKITFNGEFTFKSFFLVFKTKKSPKLNSNLSGPSQNKIPHLEKKFRFSRLRLDLVDCAHQKERHTYMNKYLKSQFAEHNRVSLKSKKNGNWFDWFLHHVMIDFKIKILLRAVRM